MGCPGLRLCSPGAGAGGWREQNILGEAAPRALQVRRSVEAGVLAAEVISKPEPPASRGPSSNLSRSPYLGCTPLFVLGLPLLQPADGCTDPRIVVWARGMSSLV